MRRFSILRLLPLITSGFMILTIAFTGVAVVAVRDMREREFTTQALFTELASASEHPIEQVRGYAQFGDVAYKDAYSKEVLETKHRERVMQQLSHNMEASSELSLLLELRNLYNSLLTLDREAIAAADNYNFDAARLIVYGDEYCHTEAQAAEKLQLLQQKMTERTAKEAHEAQMLMPIAFTLLSFVTLLQLLFITMNRRRVHKRNASIKAMAAVAANIAQGHIQTPVVDYPLNDECSLLATSLTDMMQRVQAVTDDMHSLLTVTACGNLSQPIDTSKHTGVWRDLLQGYNTLLETIHYVILDNAPVAYVYLEDGFVVSCNRCATTRVGVKVGDHMSQFTVNTAQWHGAMQLLMSRRQLSDLLAQVRVRTGQIRRFRLYGVRMPHENKVAIALWGVDVEDNEQKNASLLKSETDLAQLIDALPIAMIIVDASNEEIVYANDAYAKLFSWQQTSDCIGYTENRLFAIDTSSQPRSGTFEFTYQSATQTIVVARVTARVIHWQDRECILKIVQDIGADKHRQSALQQIAEQEREANELKSRFLVNMNHEIRTPLNAIIGLSQLSLLQETVTPPKESFRKINVAARNLLTILNDILDFSKIDTQSIDLVEDDFNLEDIIASAFLVAGERIEKKRVEMLLDLKPTVPCFLYGDKTRLWQILKNLLDNAAKYTTNGHVILKVTPLHTLDDRIHISFKVSDTGIGMTDEQLERIFDPFTQFDEQGKYQNTGTGLGMSIIKQLVTLMGGSIKMRSTPDVGTDVEVIIGFQIVSTSAVVQAQQHQSFAPDTLVLVADDDDNACYIAKNLLDSIGLRVECVQEGPAVLTTCQQYQAAGTPVSLAIIDYHLGHENGLQIAKNLLATIPDIKILILTAYADELNKEIEPLSGVKDIIAKPFIPTSFIRKIHECLDMPTAVDSWTHVQFTGARVLLCEDNFINQEVAIGILEMLGITPTVCENGAEALTLLDTQPFDLILMDILMPIMDGLEATKRIRSSGKPYQDILILSMTANVLSTQVAEFMAAGMNGHVPKPIDFEQLHTMLLQFLPPHTYQARANSADTTPTVTIEGVNTVEALARFGGNLPRYRAALADFCTMATQLMPFEDMQTDLQSAILHYHALIGVSGNLGITDVHALSQTFEATLVRGAPDATVWHTLHESCATARSAIQAALDKLAQL